MFNPSNSKFEEIVPVKQFVKVVLLNKVENDV